MEATENKLKCILLVDDDESTLLINKIVIKKSGFGYCAIGKARDGGEALDYLNNAFSNINDETPVPDLILLDINMPAIDGWDFLDEYKLMPKENTSKIKVVMLTTSMNPDDESRALNTKEVAKFMHKPLTIEALKEIEAEYFN